MMRFAIFTFAMLANASLANANEVIVKGGEHPGFTRVVMEFNDLPDWEARQFGRSQRIIFSDADLSFDLSRAFRLIGRERVSDIRLIEGGLEIDVTCECSFSVTHVASNAIAADIRPRASRPMQFHQIATMGSPAIEKNSVKLPRMNKPEQTPIPSMTSAPEYDDLFDPTGVLHPERQEIMVEFDDALLNPNQGTAIELLGRQLSRAVAQGLVDADPNTASRSPYVALGDTGLENRSNLSISTGIDRSMSPNLDNIPPTEIGAICLPNALVDVSAWGDTQDRQALGRYRSEAIGEDGRLKQEGALKLARFYVAMGFGAEAKSVAVHLADRDREILNALGDIIDNGFSYSVLLDEQVHCDGIVAMWAMLARPESKVVPIDTDKILATFSSLAPHLRSHLGPQLSETFRNAGRNEEARTVINAMTRGGDVTSESALATARLNLESSLADQARNSLGNLSVGTDVTAAKALLELLQDAEKRGMAPNPEWVIDDVPSLVRAIEGTDTADKLNVAGLRGKIALGMFDDFRKKLAEDGPGLNTESRIELAKLALSEAVASASSADFLKTEISFARIVNSQDLTLAVRLSISERLLSLGLPQRAIEYLSKDSMDNQEVELMARIFLEIEDPASAVRLLETRSKTVLQLELLAKAYLRRGEEKRAISAFESAENEKGALSSAFRSGVWEWISDRGNAQVSAPVRDLAGPIETPETNGELIESSRNIRSQARILLELTNPSAFAETFTN